MEYLNTLGQFSQVFALNVIVGLEKDFPQSALAYRIVLEVEFVESMKRVLVGMHVERIDGEVVGRQIQTLKHLSEGQMLVVTIQTDVLLI